MRNLLTALLLLAFLAGSFVAGSWYNQRNAAKGNFAVVRPAAVNADKRPDTNIDTDIGTSSLPPGAVRISAEKQQIIGVRIGEVEKTSGSHTLRTLGRVVVDENRIYRLVAGLDGWVLQVSGGTTGSIVRKDDLLAQVYGRDILQAEQSYFYLLKSQDRSKKEGLATPPQVTASNAQILAAEETLLALGMQEHQIREIAETQQLDRKISLRAPVTGLVIARNIFPQVRFERGTEWYRIADLSKVWILADIFEREEPYYRPGIPARISLPQLGKTLEAHVSDILPTFDATSRTLKLRLEANNPGFVLRPDMFVDVELPVKLPPAITVPADAIFDSGLKKTVFVDRGNGIFEPREVETGRRAGGRVEIVKGLEPGEKIAISGNFLIDSESKLELAATGMQGTLSKDPVCGFEVSQVKAKKAGRKVSYKGKAYYFDSEECKQKFQKDPGHYAGPR